MLTYDIVIATPAEMMTAAYVRSLASTIEAFEKTGISWKFVNYESCHIRQARERIINDRDDDIFDSPIPFSGHFDYEKIMWIDSDIQWKPRDVLDLYYSDRDIITGAYLMTNGRVAVSFDGIDHPYPNQIPTARQSKISTCGFGFLCVKKGVFESIPPPWFDSEIIEKDNKVTTMLGEDNSWCIKARRAGFDIWLDPNVRVIHNKTMALAWLD